MFWANIFRPKHECAYSGLSAAQNQELRLTVVFRRGEDGYIVAECLQLPGCMSQGIDEDEAKRNIATAIQSCLSAALPSTSIRLTGIQVPTQETQQ